jgi:tetrahydromethanopterin S-methyltransferase subunit G
MGTQLISFRLKDEEVALLMQQAIPPGESASLTAQRLIRQLLGTEKIPPDTLTTLISQVNEFQEKVEFIKDFVDETIDQRLVAVDRLVNTTVNQQMKAELFQIHERFDELEQRLNEYFQIQRESILPREPDNTARNRSIQPPKLPTQPLTQAELARRLINPRTGHPYSQNAITRHKERIDFSVWSEERDPQGVAWQYKPNEQLFYPHTPT